MQTQRARDSPDFIMEVSDFDTLEQMDRKTGGRHGEEWIINLQNHLIWGSYSPDPESIPVVCAAIKTAAARLGRRTEMLPEWALEILVLYDKSLMLM